MFESSLLLTDVTVVLGLLALSTIVFQVCKKIEIPFSVGLLFSGLAVALIANQFDIAPEKYIHFSPEMVFYIFLPSLVFESAYHMNFRSFKGVLREIITLSTLGLFVSIFTIGWSLHWLLKLPLGVSFLFGSLISATDPVAVLAIFKEIKAPKRLSTILDGESLVNDATALMTFQILMGLLASKTLGQFDTWFLASKSLDIFKIVGVSLGIGGVLGWLFSYAIAHAENHKIQITLSLILAHSTFIIAEDIFHASGILSTLVAGILVGNFGKMKLGQKQRRSLSEIWDFLGHISNALIFLLLGAKLGQVHFQSYWHITLIAATVTIFVARPLCVLSSFFITNGFLPPHSRLGFKSQFITIWGGLRGALAAAAVLLIPPEYPFAAVLQAMTAGTILITFLCNALTMKPLLNWLRFGEYTTNEKIQKLEAELLVSEKITGYLKEILELQYITPEIHEQLQEKYKDKIQTISLNLQEAKINIFNSERETEKILSQFALGIETRTYQKLFEYGEISEERFRTLNASVHRQISRLESDQLPDEIKRTSKIAPIIPQAPKPSLYQGSVKILRQIFWKFFEWYRNYKIISRWQHYRARRIASWKVIRDFEVLHKEHAEFKHSQVIKKIIKRYRSWHKNSQSKLKKLEKEFPHILNQARIQLVENMCLKKEEEYEKEFLNKGLINHKVYEDLEKEIHDRSIACQKHIMNLL